MLIFIFDSQDLLGYVLPPGLQNVVFVVRSSTRDQVHSTLVKRMVFNVER
jgi:hypothetical protein